MKTQQQQISTINKNEKKVKKSIENEQNVYKLKLFWISIKRK